MISPSMIYVVLIALSFTGTSFGLLKLFSRKKYCLPLPPGPAGWPLIGNLFDMPAEHEWITYNRWCKEHSTDILYLNMGGSPVVVLNSYEAAIELLETRSAIYSGRARMPMVNELMGWDFSFAFMNYGERWRQTRKLMHQSFHTGAVDEFKPLQSKMARKLIEKLENTVDVIADLRQLSGETILSIAYGIDVQPKNDPFIETAEQSVHTLLEAYIPGAFFVDSIPALKYIPEWMPGASFKRKAREWKLMAERMVNGPFDALTRAIENGTARPSFAFDGLRKMQAGEGGIYTEDNIKSVAGTMYQAGSDTTASAIAFCILSLLDHPDILRKAQDEIDSVTDSMRLPTFGDEPALPYLAALIKETLRFWSTVPLGVPHSSNVEDVYRGCRIPAGSLVIPNAWAMLHNEKIYKDPFEFNPDRFLLEDKLIHDHFNSIWGFGRRICPGRFMAYNSVWITLASIIAIYDINKALDLNGKSIQPSHDFPSSIVLFPQSFSCSFTVRSKAAAHLLAEVSSGDSESI